jgi:hypothetical protein
MTITITAPLTIAVAVEDLDPLAPYFPSISPTVTVTP